MNEHDTQVMWINSASQDFEFEPEEQKVLADGRTAMLFAKDEVNRIVQRCVSRWNWTPDRLGTRWIVTTVADPRLNWCACGSRLPTYWINDGHGFALCKVCDTCKSQKLKKYRPDIFTQYDADEPLHPDE